MKQHLIEQQWFGFRGCFKNSGWTKITLAGRNFALMDEIDLRWTKAVFPHSHNKTAGDFSPAASYSYVFSAYLKIFTISSISHLSNDDTATKILPYLSVGLSSFSSASQFSVSQFSVVIISISP